MDLKSKIASIFGQKGVTSSTGNGFTFIGNNLLSCGNVVLNENDKYNFLKINSDVSRCNDYISKKVGVNGISLVDNVTGEEVPREGNKEVYDYVNSLFSLQTWDFWKRQFLTNTNISGENYVQAVRTVETGGKIKRFEPIDSRAIHKNFSGTTGLIESFTITKLNGDSKVIPREDIGFYLYQEDPICPNSGYGVIDGIIFDILADREAGRTNYYTFENNGVPGAIFTLAEGIKDPAQLKIAQDLIDKKFKGSKNSNKILASPHITDVKVLNLSNKDLEYIGGRQFSSTKIASAFGLHPKLIGYEGKTGSYSEIKEIRKEVYDTTIRGFERYLENVMNTLVDKFEEELEMPLAGYDIIVNSQSFDDDQEVYAGQREDYKLGLLTANQILRYRGLPETEDTAYGEARYIASNLVKVGEDPTPGE